MTNLENEVMAISEEQLSQEQRKAIQTIMKGHNIFIQGQAGSGKSAFIKFLQAHSLKNIVLCSPTGIAALNIGGVTLHSLFRLPISDYITDTELFRMNRKTVWSTIKAIDILIIDEVSMVRPDILDAVDKVCRRAKHNSNIPFGGIQVVLIGDLYQLPPIIKTTSIPQFEALYGTNSPYFFDANSYKEGKFHTIKFTKVFRQNDKELLKNLINIRTAKNIPSTLKYFNTCKISDENRLKTAVTITPYRAIAEEINNTCLKKLKTKAKTFKATLTGTFRTASDSNCPAQKELTLKEGALVIFNRNDSNKQWVNGSVGIVDKINSHFLTVTLVSTGETVAVRRETWENKEYTTKLEKKYNALSDKIEEKEVIKEKVIGEFMQFPLQLGYGLTIHKAQGKTLDCVNIDLDKGAFAHGQLYVALSRTRTKADMNIVSKITPRDIIFDMRVSEFLNK